MRNNLFADAKNPNQVVILMGEYIVIEKGSTTVSKIESPAAQTCVVLKLESEAGIAVAHIDSPAIAAKVIHDMVQELEDMDESLDIKAELVGGDKSIANQGSSLLVDTITKELKKENIHFRYEHHSYYVPDVILPLMYLALRATNIVGPESYIVSAICLMIAFVINYKSNSLLGNSFDVSIDVKSGKISVVTNNQNNSERIVKEAQPHQYAFLEERMKVNPRKATAQQLQMQKHFMSSSKRSNDQNFSNKFRSNSN